MPNMAAITVKKLDGTTDLVFNAMTPSSGDQSPAVWRAENGTPVNAYKPRFEIKTRWDAQKSRRRADVLLVVPIVSTIDGVTKVIDTMTFSGVANLPQTVDPVAVDEGSNYLGQLLHSSLALQVFQTGFAPN